MLQKLLLVLIIITFGHHGSMGQEVMEAYLYSGVPAVETAGRVFSLNGNLVLVGRSGVWALDSSDHSWVRIFRPRTGSLIVESTEGIDGTILFLDSDRKVWRVVLSGAVESVPVEVSKGDSHLLCETSSGLFVVRYSRVLGTIDGEMFTGTERKVVPTLSPPVKYATPYALVYNAHCKQHILTVYGIALDNPAETRFLTYEMSGDGWKLVDDWSGSVKTDTRLSYTFGFKEHLFLFNWRQILIA